MPKASLQEKLKVEFPGKTSSISHGVLILASWLLMFLLLTTGPASEKPDYFY
jgi:hypothetical protein